jgi:hypothetical protein
MSEDAKMDAIKEAMIREETTGETNPALDPYRVRSCTCHPDDLPPDPCPKRYALTECRAAAYNQARALMLLQSSSCYRGDCCSVLPCACAETIVRFAERFNAPSAECAVTPDPASRPGSDGSRSIRLGATDIAARLVDGWREDFWGRGRLKQPRDAALGELTRRIATALVGEPRETIMGREQSTRTAVIRGESPALPTLGPYYDIACELAHGFDCGNCDEETARAGRCREYGCVSLRDGIFEELKAAASPI